MNPKKHQRKAARKLISRLKQYGISILAGEARSGKTLSFILASHKLHLKEVLIISTKKALDDIKKTTILYPNTKFVVTNYHQVINLKQKEYQLIILDEFHRYISTASPKHKSTIWKEIYKISYFTPIIFSSGTPTPETYASIYSPLALSCKSPFNRYKNFTAWHKDYGIPYDIIIEWDSVKKRAKRKAKGYDKVKIPKVKKAIEHLIVSITRKEAGHKYEAEDKLHHIPLTDYQEQLYKALDKDRMYELPEEDYTILADTAATLPFKKHQISGGFVKAVNDLNESETFNHQVGTNKIQYIKDNFNPKKTMIVAFYIPEQEYLATIFPNVESITKICEGTDLSHFDDLVIYSFGFHAVTYQQIRARLLNFEKRDKEAIVHFLLSGIDKDVYTAVAIDKKNFTYSWYKRR
jgi:hypothetical protein